MKEGMRAGLKPNNQPNEGERIPIPFRGWIPPTYLGNELTNFTADSTILLCMGNRLVWNGPLPSFVPFRWCFPYLDDRVRQTSLPVLRISL